VQRTLVAGLIMSAASVALLTRIPVHGNYFTDLFPAFVLGGTGLSLTFVPVTIASLAGVDRSDAGVASGLVNTSRQIGGAIGIAAISAIAATSTSNYVDSHPGTVASSAVALHHGLQTALYVLAALLVAAAAIAATLVRPAPVAAPVESIERVEETPIALEEAA
jgi:hypothetical protein